MDDSFQVLVNYVVAKVREQLTEEKNKSLQLRKAVAPENLRKQLDLAIPEKNTSPSHILGIIEEVVKYSVNTNHPYFMNQMFGKMQPIAFLADVMISVLNTSMYTYEVAPALTLIEKETVGFLAGKIWGKAKGDGVFTSGGSMSNMKALLLARQFKLNQSKNTGLFNQKPVAIFVSEQAHYSFTKAVNFMGFGTETLVKIKSDAQARIDVEELQNAILRSIDQGREPMMLVAVAGTTISASFDNVEKLSNIAKKYKMWFHVDAAFGGALLFSDNEKYKLNGIDNADSVTWNFHKAMGMPLSTSSFLTKEKGDLNEAFHVNADYLFHYGDDDFDLGQKSLQGGRRPEALKLWLSLKYEGEIGFKNRIEKLRNRAKSFAQFIEKKPNFELFMSPDATIVCFRYVPENTSLSEANQLNTKIRDAIFNEGNIIFNYAPLHDVIYLRCVLLDPEITENELKNILDIISEKAEQLKAKILI